MSVNNMYQPVIRPPCLGGRAQIGTTGNAISTPLAEFKVIGLPVRPRYFHESTRREIIREDKLLWHSSFLIVLRNTPDLRLTSSTSPGIDSK